jgi:hypothetical protein
MTARHIPDPENSYMFRQAKNRDLCILLIPGKENSQLLQHQNELQSICGGKVMRPVHLTAQRIEEQDGSSLEALSSKLRANLLDFPPMPIRAVSFRSLYSPYRKAFLLKWVAEMNEPLRLFSEQVEKTIHAAGYRSLYQPGWISTWITALEGIKCASLPVYLDNIEIPLPLFIGSEIIISQINGRDDYIILDQFALNNKI